MNKQVTNTNIVQFDIVPVIFKVMAEKIIDPVFTPTFFKINLPSFINS